MIALDKVKASNGGFRLGPVTLNVPSGAYAALMGRTGCGKTTLLETVCGLLSAESGSIRLDGRDVTRLKAAERGIGYVPQDGALFATMTVFENIAFSQRIRRCPKALVNRRVHELAEVMDLKNLLARKPEGLSGGEKQRVALARALAAHPAILCLDEPLASLDYETRQRMFVLLREIKTRFDVTTLHVTHDPHEADVLADVTFRFENGHVVSQTS